jgi:hypothetical protein
MCIDFTDLNKACPKDEFTLPIIDSLMDATVKRPDPLGLKCHTITSPRRLVNTFLTSNSTEFR